VRINVLTVFRWLIFLATGIASLILASNLLFSVIKWFGVSYLLYLGITALFSKSGAIKINVKTKESSRKKLFSQGLVVQLAEQGKCTQTAKSTALSLLCSHYILRIF